MFFVRGFSMFRFQVSVRFVFCGHKAALVSTHIKQQNAAALPLLSCPPLGSGLKFSRFFKTKKEAARYVSFLRSLYKNRVAANPPLPGGQLVLF
jgi:hypothetical protein